MEKVKNIRTIITCAFILMSCVILTTLSGCKTHVKESDMTFWDKFVAIEERYDPAESGYLYTVYDVDTKVEYFISISSHRYGMCPVYDENGNVKIYTEDHE